MLSKDATIHLQPRDRRFTYSRLDNPRRSIRLLKFTQQRQSSDTLWTLHIVPLSREIRFIALSYVWGSPQETESFHLGRKTVTISKNLADALRHLEVILRESNDPRLLGCEHVWADALCINQSDDEEKSHQVQIMQKIYSSAMATVGWLGSEAAESEGALRSLEIIANSLNLSTQAVTMPFHRSRKVREESLDLIEKWVRTGRLPITSLELILQNRFWQRVWILRETIAPRELLYACGYHVVDWIALFTIVYIMDEFRFTINPATDKTTYDIVNPVEAPLRYLWRRARALNPYNVPAIYSNVQDLLIMVRANCVATDPRDLIYALNGILSGNIVEADYSISVKSLYTAVAAKYVQPGASLDWILSQAERPQESKYDLPSWVPDWTVPALPPLYEKYRFNVRTRQRSLSRFPEPNNVQESLGLSYLVNEGILRIEGYAIDTVKLVSFDSFADMDQPDALRLWIMDFESILKLSHSKYSSDAKRLNIALKVAIACSYPTRRDVVHWRDCPMELSKMKKLAIGRKAFTTETGHAGLGPKSMKPGDLVCVAEADMPIILTKGKEERLRYLGQAYLYGVMHGRVKMAIVDNLKKQTFEIE